MASNCTVLTENSLCGPNYEGYPVDSILFPTELDVNNFIQSFIYDNERVVNHFRNSFACTGAEIETAVKYRRYQASIQCALWIQGALKEGCVVQPGLPSQFALCADRCMAGLQSVASTFEDNNICPPSADPLITEARTTFLTDQSNYCTAAKNFVLQSGTPNCGWATTLEERTCGYTSKEIAAFACNTDNLSATACCVTFFEENPTLKNNPTSSSATLATAASSSTATPSTNSADINATPRSSITIGIVGIVIAVILAMIALVAFFIIRNRRRRTSEFNDSQDVKPFKQRDSDHSREFFQAHSNYSSPKQSSIAITPSVNHRQTPPNRPQNPAPSSPSIHSFSTNQSQQNLNNVINYETQFQQRLSQISQQKQQPYQQYEQRYSHKEPSPQAAPAPNISSTLSNRDTLLSETANVFAVAASAKAAGVSISSPVIKPEEVKSGISPLASTSNGSPSQLNSTATTATTANTQLQKLLVVLDYYPTQDDELRLKEGSTLSLVSSFDDGWALGIDTATGQQGAFPLVCVRKIEEPALSLPVIGSDEGTRNISVPGNKESFSQQSTEYAAISKRISSQISPNLMGEIFAENLKNVKETPIYHDYIQEENTEKIYSTSMDNEKSNKNFRLSFN
ncbi:hypothetical protein HK099_000233 [Clydaea vesicula]|uniref:SH3 domain-containing protein n=1 Tax=Clydaea vesicula TaxID=447962 RepID=A0AAD5XSX9_9FUNG|nr:hypothetical protein HK099_000233 [Clydaea vesicula]